MGKKLEKSEQASFDSGSKEKKLSDESTKESDSNKESEEIKDRFAIIQDKIKEKYNPQSVSL